jgi:hypothetical protein
MSRVAALIPRNLPLLCNGDRMTRVEFHRRYSAYPEKVKVELIGGVVYFSSPLTLPSPTRWAHGRYLPRVSAALSLYEAATAGVEAAGNATILLDEHNEPQPDLSLRIRDEYGGRSWVNAEEFVEGPPELLAEVAHSSRALDMHQKRESYEKAGVREYVVLCTEEGAFHWFDFAAGRPIRPDRNGVARSRVFPGLWIQVGALLTHDTRRLIDAVQQGLASRAHAAFVKRLDEARRGRK